MGRPNTEDPTAVMTFTALSAAGVMTSPLLCDDKGHVVASPAWIEGNKPAPIF